MQILLLLFLLFSNFFYSPNENNSTFNYTNTKLGFSLELPTNWKGKVYIQESDSRVSFMYKSVSGNEDAELFDIFLISPIQYKVHEEYVGFYRYLGQRDELVIAKFSPTGVPYDDLNSLQKQDFDNFFILYKDVNSILETFKLTNEHDNSIYKQVIKESSVKDEEFRKEYERIIRDELKN